MNANDFTATRVKHRGRTAISVSGPGLVGNHIVGGARAERCDWVIIATAMRWERLDGEESYRPVPVGVEVYGVRACEAAAYAEAGRRSGGMVVKVQEGGAA